MVSVGDSIKILITGDGAAAVTEFKKVGAAADQNLKKAQSSSDKLGSTLTKVGVGAVGAGLAIGAGLFKAAEAASEADLAQRKLQNTIHNSAALVGASTEAFNKQADALEKTTVYSHVQTTTVQALLGQYKLTQAQIIQLVPRVEDLASKMGIDVVSATKAVGKSVEGTGGGLQKMGIITGVTKTGTHNFDLTLQALNKTVGGFSKSEGKTFTGQLTEMKNQLKHTEEEIGRGAIPVMKEFGHIVGGAADVFLKMDDATGGAIGKFAAYGAAALIVGGAVTTVTGLVIKMGGTYGILKTKLLGAKDASIATADADKALAVTEGTTTKATEVLGDEAVATEGKVAGMGAAAVTAGGSAGLGALGTSILSTASLLGKLQFAAVGVGLYFSEKLEKMPAPKQDTDALKRLSDAENLLSKSGIDAGKAQSGFAKAIHSSNPSATIAEWGKQAGLSATQIKVLEQAFKLLFPHLDKLKHGADAAATSVKSVGDADYAAAQQSDAFATKLKDLGDAAKTANDHLYDMATAVNATHDAQRGALSSVLTYQDDIAGLTDKQKAYTDAVNQYGKDSPQAAAAQRAYAEAALTASGDVDAAKNSILGAAKASAGGATSGDAFKKALQEFALTLAPNSTLRVWLDQYIAELHNVPTSIHTSVDIQSNSQIQGGGVRAGSGHIIRDKGGWIPGSPGQPVPMIGHAGEYVLSRAMLNGAATPGINLAKLRAGGGGATTVNQYITITNPDPKAVVDALNRAALAGTRPNSRVLTGV